MMTEKTENTEEPSQPVSGGAELPSLQEFFTTLQGKYDSLDAMAVIEGDLLENYYPGLSSIAAVEKGFSPFCRPFQKKKQDAKNAPVYSPVQRAQSGICRPPQKKLRSGSLWQTAAPISSKKTNTCSISFSMYTEYGS